MKFSGYIPKHNDTRIIKRFALFPITIYDTGDPWLERTYYDRRWLETVYIEQRYTLTGYWDNYRFVDKDTYIKEKSEGGF